MEYMYYVSSLDRYAYIGPQRLTYLENSEEEIEWIIFVEERPDLIFFYAKEGEV